MYMSFILIFSTLYAWYDRTASKPEINKAYRNLAQQWHPDAYDGEDKAKAEKMFYDIAAAKEVLTDPGQYEHDM